MRMKDSLRLIPLLSAFLGGVSPLAAPAQTAGGVAATGPATRVVRSVAGTKGSQQAGRYVIEDPKTAFHIPGDKEVIVYFEWDGSLGFHNFEGRWKNPEGKAVVVSDFKYEAKQKRFGAYWSLLLSETTMPGLWALEALVDGEITGTHTFQILAAPGVGPAAPIRKLLNPSEVYQKGVAATVYVEKLDSGRKVLSTGSGFFLGSDRLLTAFQAIDGAGFLRVRFPDGRQSDVTTVSAWHRWQDWAVLRVDAGATPILPVAEDRSWQVGDRIFFLTVKTEGSRTIVDANITGTSKTADGGERMDLSTPFAGDSIGSPVVNEYGDVIGMLGGLPFPGAWWRDPVRSYFALHASGSGATAVPTELVVAGSASQQPAALESMLTNGQFLPPIAEHRDISRATIARYLDSRTPGFTNPQDEKFEYSRKDREAFLYVLWEPKIKRKGQVSFRVYGLDNRMLSQSKPGKINLRPGEFSTSTWQLNVSTWPLGIYRIDIIIDQDTMWRGFLKVVE